MCPKLVYSTEGLHNVDDELKDSKKVKPFNQHIYLHLERKGGGRIITIIRGLEHSKSELVQLSKEIKKNCSVGGTVKKKEILIQGNFREKIKSLLITKGYNVKLSGG